MENTSQVKHRSTCAGLLSAVFWLLAQPAMAAVDVDLRASAPVDIDADSASYVLAINDCTQLVQVEVGAGGTLTAHAPRDLLRDPAHPRACSLPFSVSAPVHLEPAAELAFADGTTQSYGEVFTADLSSPSVSLAGISIVAEGDDQILVAELTASDDLDIAYLSVSMTGFRASGLRAAGGVVAAARQNAFAATGSPVRLYPTTDSQTAFFLRLPISSPLSAAEIASDGVVIVDATVSDAAGLQTSLSRISFTGDDVTDTPLQLELRPNPLVFTNALETASLTPLVEFQFRGLTALPGAGNGVSYTSSHPDLVFVSPAGLVYPLEETGTESVTIVASYPGVPDAEIDVEVDYNKVLTGVRLQGVGDANPLRLAALNTWFELPSVEGLFDDGSVAPVTNLTPIFTVPAGTESFLVIDSRKRILARAIIPDTTPALVGLTSPQAPKLQCHWMLTRTNCTFPRSGPQGSMKLTTGF